MRHIWKTQAAGVLVAIIAAAAFAWLASAGTAGSRSGPPAAGQQYPKKTTLCHRTKSRKAPTRTIRVAQSAVRAHLRHGDKRGTCASVRAKFSVCHKAKGKRARTIKVRGTKVRGHLKHGDQFRTCKKPKAKKK